jgi:hypothetical protein
VALLIYIYIYIYAVFTIFYANLFKLTSRIFIRNVITQVIERNLILGMLRLFDPAEILRMSDQTVKDIASENEETRQLRISLKAKKKAIEEAQDLCASLSMRSELRNVSRIYS